MKLILPARVNRDWPKCRDWPKNPPVAGARWLQEDFFETYTRSGVYSLLTGTAPRNLNRKIKTL